MQLKRLTPNFLSPCSISIRLIFIDHHMYHILHKFTCSLLRVIPVVKHMMRDVARSTLTLVTLIEALTHSPFKWRILFCLVAPVKAISASYGHTFIITYDMFCTISRTSHHSSYACQLSHMFDYMHKTHHIISSLCEITHLHASWCALGVMIIRCVCVVCVCVCAWRCVVRLNGEECDSLQHASKREDAPCGIGNGYRLQQLMVPSSFFMVRLRCQLDISCLADGCYDWVQANAYRGVGM